MIRESPRAEYYPEGYHPELLTAWPVDGDLVVPLDAAPPQMTSGMGESWRQRKAYEQPMKEREEASTEKDGPAAATVATPFDDIAGPGGPAGVV